MEPCQEEQEAVDEAQGIRDEAEETVDLANLALLAAELLLLNALLALLQCLSGNASPAQSGRSTTSSGTSPRETLRMIEGLTPAQHAEMERRFGKPICVNSYYARLGRMDDKPRAAFEDKYKKMAKRRK